MYILFYLLVGKVIVSDYSPMVKVYVVEDDINSNSLYEMILQNLNFYDITDVNDVTDISKLPTILSQPTTKTIFIWANRNVETIKTFFGDSNFNPINHVVYSYIFFDLSDYSSCSSCAQNIIDSTKIFTIYKRNDTIFENFFIAEITGTSHKYNIIDYLYYNSFKLLIEGHKKTGTFIPAILLESLYNKRNINSGMLVVLPHNYISSSYYLIKYKNTNGKIEVLHKFNPNIYFDPKEIHGNVPLIHCSWQANPITGKVNISPIVMLFINEMNQFTMLNYVYSNINIRE